MSPGPRPYHAGRFASQRPGWLPPWQEPKHPGSTILRLDLRRGEEVGDVRVQWYGDDKLKVGSFTPGVVESSPGDTPKVWPESSVWVGDADEASKMFVELAQAAMRDGWTRL